MSKLLMISCRACGLTVEHGEPLTCMCQCDSCFEYGRECYQHGDVCGACGAYIVEEAEKGDGTAMYHGRDDDCRSIRELTF